MTLFLGLTSHLVLLFVNPSSKEPSHRPSHTRGHSSSVAGCPALPCYSFSHHLSYGSSHNSNVPHVLCVSLTLQTFHGTLVLEPHYLCHPRRERHLSLCEATVTCGRCRPVRSPGRAGQRTRCPQMTGCYGPICVQDHLTEGPAHTGELQTPLALLCKQKDTQAH